MNDILDQPFSYRQSFKGQSPYSNRGFIRGIKNRLRNYMTPSKRESQDQFEFRPVRDESINDMTITQGSFKNYVYNARANQQHSMNINFSKDFTFDLSPTNQDTIKLGQHAIQLPSVVIVKNTHKIPKRKKRMKSQNPQEGTIEEIKIELPNVEVKQIVSQQPIQQLQQQVVQDNKPIKHNRSNRFDQIMKFKHDEQIGELKQMLKQLNKPKQFHKKKVTFQI